MITTNKELADWIFDRLAQGQNEVVIQVAEIDEKDNHYCDVLIDCGVIYSDYINDNTPYETIHQNIEEWYGETKTKQ